MKLLISLAALSLLSISADKCGGKTTDSSRYKAKLEIKGICMNYTLRLLEGTIDTSLISTVWTDEHSGKSYTRVFGLGSPCTFPATIKEGDEFYFTIDSTSKQNCPVCLAYYPTPPKKLSIKVFEK